MDMQDIIRRHAEAARRVAVPALEAHEIVQITDESHHWYPCLVVVTEVKPWGVQGYITIPRNDGEPCGNAYIRLENGTFEPVGAKALLATEPA